MDVERLQLGGRERWNGEIPPSLKPPRHRKGGEFLKGPVPLDWLRRAASLGGKSLAVGLVLWFDAGRKNTRKIRLTQSLLTRFEGLEVAQPIDSLPRVHSNLIDGYSRVPIRWRIAAFMDTGPT